MQEVYANLGFHLFRFIQSIKFRLLFFLFVKKEIGVSPTLFKDINEQKNKKIHLAHCYGSLFLLSKFY